MSSFTTSTVATSASWGLAGSTLGAQVDFSTMVPAPHALRSGGEERLCQGADTRGPALGWAGCTGSTTRPGAHPAAW